MRALRAIALSLLLLAGLPAGAGAAGDRVLVRGGEHEGFGRLVFDWATSVDYQAEIVGRELIVTFAAPAEFDLGPLRRDLEDYIGPARAAADGRSVSIPLKSDVTLKHMTLGPKIVIDLIAAGPDAKPPRDKEAAASPPRTEAAAETKTAVPAAPSQPTQPSTQSGPQVLVRVGEHPEFSRLVFDWPTAVGYRVEETPGRATVRFDSPARLDLSRYRRDPAERVLAFVPRSHAEGLAVDLALPPGSKIRHYADGGQVVVDVLGDKAEASVPPPEKTAASDTAAPPTPAKAEPDQAASHDTSAQTKPEKTAAAQPADAEPAADQGQPPTSLLPPQREKPADPAQTAERRDAEAAPARDARPDAGEEGETALAAKDRKDAGQATAPPSAESGEEKGLSQSPAAMPIAENKNSEPPAAAESEDAKPMATDVDLVAAGETGAPLADTPTPGQTATLGKPVALRLNWAEPVGAAAFLYGGRLWLVFDRPVKSNIAKKIAKAAPGLAPIDQLPHDRATVLRVSPPAGFSAELKVEEDDWVVSIRPQENDRARALAVEIDQGGEESSLHVLADDLGQLIELTDPDLGAPLRVVTIRTPQHGLTRQYSLPGVRVLPTYHGVAVELLSDTIAVATDDKGVVVSGEGGLNASAEQLREAQRGGALAMTPGRSLLDVEAWRGRGPFLARKQALQQEIVDAGRGRADIARLDLARFYFAHGLASEALGALRLIERHAPRLVADPQFRLLKAASELLDSDYEAALQALSHPVLAGERDANLWKGALAAVSEDWPTAARLLTEGDPLIEAYAPQVRNKLWLLAAEARLQIADDGAALQYLDFVRKNEPSVFDQARIAYLEGRRYLQNDDRQKAMDTWQELADAGYGAPSARARLALIEQGQSDGSLPREEAIKQLERLRFAWRGDAFEFALLERLGELYLEGGRYRDALLALRQAASYLPGAARGKAVAQRMREVFSDLFLSEVGKKVPPVAALAIYREFKELMPGGDEGDRLVERLADRLVAVDLLAQAAELLQNQVDNRLTGEAKARIGRRIAALYLTDRRPQDALQALSKSDVEDLPANLAHARRDLKVKAMIEAGAGKQALAVLGDDQDDGANRLRARIYWSEQRWAEAAASLESLLPKRLPSGFHASDDDARFITSLAVAYTLAGDRNALASLDWRFGDVMSATPQSDTFAMLTGNLEAGPMISVADELSGVDAIQAFVAGFITNPDSSEEEGG